jgi:hypothetical protein
MNLGIILGCREAEIGGRQAADRRQDGVRGDDLIVLRRNKLNARVEQRLLGGQHVECRALADFGLFAHAGERDFRRSDLSACDGPALSKTPANETASATRRAAQK